MTTRHDIVFYGPNDRFGPAAAAMVRGDSNLNVFTAGTQTTTALATSSGRQPCELPAVVRDHLGETPEWTDERDGTHVLSLTDGGEAILIGRSGVFRLDPQLRPGQEGFAKPVEWPGANVVASRLGADSLSWTDVDVTCAKLLPGSEHTDDARRSAEWLDNLPGIEALLGPVAPAGSRATSQRSKVRGPNFFVAPAAPTPEEEESRAVTSEVLARMRDVPLPKKPAQAVRYSRLRSAIEDAVIAERRGGSGPARA